MIRPIHQGKESQQTIGLTGNSASEPSADDHFDSQARGYPSEQSARIATFYMHNATRNSLALPLLSLRDESGNSDEQFT